MARRIGWCFLLLLAGCAAFNYDHIARQTIQTRPEDVLAQAVVGPRDDGTYVVPTTQMVSPAGETCTFPGRPNDLAVSPDGAWLAVANALRPGNARGEVHFLDLTSNVIAQTLTSPNDGFSFCGIIWNSDGDTLYVSDVRDEVHEARRGPDGTFAWVGAIPLPGPGKKGHPAPGGLALDEAQGRLYVALSRNNTIGVVDLTSREVVNEIPVGVAPYTVLLAGAKAYVTNWGGRHPREGDKTALTSGSPAVVDEKTGIISTGTVSVIDLETGQVVKEVAVGLHPCGMALSPDGARLYVANANSDTVSVVDTATGEVAATFQTRPMPRLPFGSAPNALALSQDGSTLFVANGGNNVLAVMDASTGAMRGLIPTGWYPGSVAVTRDGGRLCVANTKGVGSRYVAPKEAAKNDAVHGYNTHHHMGSVSIIPIPSRAALKKHTLRAAENMRLPMMQEVLDMAAGAPHVVPVPVRPGETSVFKHVLYIIKENRTYDQVFGDMPQGDGEPSLCMFGREVTPNHHALAEEFVLFDNFYCNGILSADGHQWTDEGYVTDYIEKSFGGWPRSYPYDGDDPMAYASSGFIWDKVLEKGLTFRDYGEFVKAKIEPAGATWRDIYNDYLNGTRNVTIRATTRLHTLEPYLCPTFVGFPGSVQDVYRAQEFIRELEAFEAQGVLPDFIIMLLPNDHTVGTTPGYPTPEAAVADNDLALGRIVEAVSRSKFWPETVILVVEDDPQAGLDHVDAHRTVALCISPYTRRGVVDSTHYNQSSILRTIELIFGLAPMNQMTMAANPIEGCFMQTPDFTPYSARPNNIPLDTMNPDVAELKGKQKTLAKLSLRMPLDDIDQADEYTFNRILWHAVKGYDVPYPKRER